MLLALAWRALGLVHLDDRLLASQVPALWAEGWFRSRREGRCVDLAGEPVPWITYPATHFLLARLRPELAVFEYGCGGSTRWWAARVGRVISVEHDAGWAARVSAELPGNAAVVHVPLDAGGAYARNAGAHGVGFDVIVIDGRDRVHCVPNAIQALNPQGVIVFDDTDRPAYAPGVEALAAAGFRRLEFAGLKPLTDLVTETSIFYRPGNCLGI